MKSLKQLKKALQFTPPGVNFPVRAYGSIDCSPVFIAKGKGSKIYDIDGNEYIDYVCSWGALILGYSHPSVVRAIQAAAKLFKAFFASMLKNGIYLAPSPFEAMFISVAFTKDTEKTIFAAQNTFKRLKYS